MKKPILAAAILMVSFACKKEKNNSTTATPTQQTKQLSVKVNGVESGCASCYYAYKSGNIRTINFYTSDTEEFSFFFTDLPTAGSYTLSKSNAYPYAMYLKDSTSYNVSIGTLNITSVDTSQKGVINKLEGSFNFKTDTVNGIFFTLSEGTINLK